MYTIIRVNEEEPHDADHPYVVKHSKKEARTLLEDYLHLTNMEDFEDKCPLSVDVLDSPVFTIESFGGEHISLITHKWEDEDNVPDFFDEYQGVLTIEEIESIL